MSRSHRKSPTGRAVLALATVAASISLAACGSSGTTEKATAPDDIDQPATGTLRVFSYEDSVTPEMMNPFKAQNPDLDVKTATFDSDSEAAAKLAGGFQADVVEVQTHAWFEAAIPGFGWLALDPTNSSEVGLRHVKIGHGRDYDDVPPMRGVYAGGAVPKVDVVVEIRRMAATPSPRSLPPPSLVGGPSPLPSRAVVEVDDDHALQQQRDRQQQQQQQQQQ